MMLVETRLCLSAIHGIGLFAAQFIPQGTAVWEFTQGFDLSLPKGHISHLCAPALKHFLNIAYVSRKTGNYIYCCDHAGYFNHSPSPNVRCIRLSGDGELEDICVAVRDIPAAEEMTADYWEFDADPWDIAPAN
jgi:SET domain-containing protein